MLLFQSVTIWRAILLGNPREERQRGSKGWGEKDTEGRTRQPHSRLEAHGGTASQGRGQVFQRQTQLLEATDTIWGWGEGVSRSGFAKLKARIRISGFGDLKKNKGCFLPQASGPCFYEREREGERRMMRFEIQRKAQWLAFLFGWSWVLSTQLLTHWLLILSIKNNIVALLINCSLSVGMMLRYFTGFLSQRPQR